MKDIRQKYTFTLLDSDQESNNEPSLTIPDQSLTIPQILERYVSGIDLPYGPDGFYETDYDEDDFTTDPLLDPALDLSDVTEAQVQAQMLKNSLQKEVIDEEERSDDEEKTTKKKDLKTSNKPGDEVSDDI